MPKSKEQKQKEALDRQLASNRAAYRNVHFPQWINDTGSCARSSQFFIDSCLKLNRHARDAQLSMSGAIWPAEEIDRLEKRDPNNFWRMMQKPGERERLIEEFQKERARFN